MFEFEVTINFTNVKPRSETFLAEAWEDAYPQALEIVRANAEDGDMIDFKVDRVGDAG